MKKELLDKIKNMDINKKLIIDHIEDEKGNYYICAIKIPIISHEDGNIVIDTGWKYNKK